MTIKKKAVALAATTGVLLAMTACSGSNKPADGNNGEQITLTVGVFNDFGYGELYKEYMEKNPHIKIEEQRAGQAGDARTRIKTNLAASSGLADVEGIEGGWMPEFLQYPDKWVDLTDDSVKDRWYDWKTEKATVDGKLYGYGTDAGPNAICYRADLLEKAGLGSTREEVAKRLEGDWENFVNVGKEFVSKSGGVAWVDSSNALYEGMISQMPNPFENSDDTPIPLDQNADIKKVYDLITSNTDLSAHMQQWEPDWMASFQGEPKFAVTMCPSWMAGFIQDQAKGVKGWDIAPVFPGGASNTGGSYLMVPTQSKHQEEAKKLANWLTAPEQQLKAYKAKGVYPSQIKAVEELEGSDEPNEFFNNAPMSKIYAEQSKQITMQPFVGKNYGTIRQVVGDALSRVDSGAASAEDSWQQALADYKEKIG